MCTNKKGVPFRNALFEFFSAFEALQLRQSFIWELTLDRLNSLAEQLDQQAVSPDPSPEPRDLLVVPGDPLLVPRDLLVVSRDLLLVQLGRLPERRRPQPDARRQLRLHANDRARLHVNKVQRRRQQLQNLRNRRHCRGPKCFRWQYSRTELSRTPSVPACSMSEPISSSPTFQKAHSAIFRNPETA